MTHGEYVYDLLKRLQRHFRCTDSGYRMYLYNFYFHLLNYPGVVLTEESHANFVKQMDTDCVYYGNKGLTSLQSIYNDENYATSYAMLQKSFAAIGITLEVIEGGEGACNFTMPDGVVLYLKSSYANYSYFCARSGMDYEYAQKATKNYYYDELEDADEMNGMVAGYGTFWEFDTEDNTLEISGEGALVSSTLFSSVTTDNQFLSSSSSSVTSAVNTIILGAGVNRLMKYSLSFSKNLTLVCLRGARAELIMDNLFAGGDSDTTYDWTIYTDNADLIKAKFPTRLNVTFKTLAEWDG